MFNGRINLYKAYKWVKGI